MPPLLGTLLDIMACRRQLLERCMADMAFHAFDLRRILLLGRVAVIVGLDRWLSPRGSLSTREPGVKSTRGCHWRFPNLLELYHPFDLGTKFAWHRTPYDHAVIRSIGEFLPMPNSLRIQSIRNYSGP